MDQTAPHPQPDALPPLARNAALRAAGIGIALVLSGCATYHPLPLGPGHGASSVDRLSAPTMAMPLPMLPTHRFDPSDGLDATEVAMLAVVNSPELRLKRDALGIARAQAFAAGLLPDPQLALSADFPRQSGAGLNTAYSLGLSEDITALLTRSSRKAAARSQASQVNLDLLWAEWQTVAQARLLFDQVSSLRLQQSRLEQEQAALATVSGYIKAALQAGNLTYDSASAGLNAEADVRKRLADTTIALHQAQSDLHLLLGLALPAGYQSQEAKVRSAILAQFPALNIGFNTARDTSAVYTNGLSIGITLPLFDRNRGNIAIERAARQQLHDDYTARVLGTRSDMQRITLDLTTLDSQLATLRTHATQLDKARVSAARAWRAGTLDWPTYLAIRSNALGADLDLLGVQLERARQSIALEALLGNTDLANSHPVSAKASTP